MPKGKNQTYISNSQKGLKVSGAKPPKQERKTGKK